VTKNASPVELPAMSYLPSNGTLKNAGARSTLDGPAFRVPSSEPYRITVSANLDA